MLTPMGGSCEWSKKKITLDDRTKNKGVGTNFVTHNLLLVKWHLTSCLVISPLGTITILGLLVVLLIKPRSYNNWSITFMHCSLYVHVMSQFIINIDTQRHIGKHVPNSSELLRSCDTGLDWRRWRYHHTIEAGASWQYTCILIRRTQSYTFAWKRYAYYPSQEQRILIRRTQSYTFAWKRYAYYPSQEQQRSLDQCAAQ